MYIHSPQQACLEEEYEEELIAPHPLSWYDSNTPNKEYAHRPTDRSSLQGIESLRNFQKLTQRCIYRTFR